MAPAADEDERDQDEQADEVETDGQGHSDEVAGQEEDAETMQATAAVKKEEKHVEPDNAVGSSREQQIDVDDDDDDNLSLSSSDVDAVLKEEEEFDDSDAPFDELSLPLRIYIGTYTGSLYALESVHSLHYMLTSPPLPPTELHSPASTTGRPASAFYTLFNTDAHRASIHAVACSPQGSHLVSSGVDEVVQLYKLEGERRHVGSLHRHYASVNQLQFPSSHTFLSASDDGTVAVFSSAHQWEMVKRLSSSGTAGVVSMSLHPSHRVLLTSSSDGVVRMWDMVRGVEATRRRVKFDHPSVTAGGSGQVREEVKVQWEEAGKGYVMVRGKVLTVYDEQGAIHRVVHADSRILSFHFIAPSLLVAGCEDCSLRCWDANTGEQLWVQQQHTARIRCLDYLRLANQQLLIVSASTDGQVWLWRGVSEGGVRSGVERVGGAKSEARITAVCCGVRWHARRPLQKESVTQSAAEQSELVREVTAEGEEQKASAAHNASEGGDRMKPNKKRSKRQALRSTATGVEGETEQNGRGATAKGKQKQQANKPHESNSGVARVNGQQRSSTSGGTVRPTKAQPSPVTNGGEKGAAGKAGKRGIVVVQHKRRTR